MHDYTHIASLDVCKSLGIDRFRYRKNQVLNGSAFVRKLEDIEEHQYEEAKKQIVEVTKQCTDWLDYLHQCFKGLIETFVREKQIPMTILEPQLSRFTYSIFELGLSAFPLESSLIERQPIEEFQNEIDAMQARLHQSAGEQQNFEEYFVSLIKAGVRTQHGVNAPTTRSPTSESSSPPRAEHPLARRRTMQAPTPVYSREFVPFARGKLLGKWMCDTTELERVTLSRPVGFSNMTVSVILPEGNLLSCGGRDQYESRAITINTQNGNVTLLPDMQKGRGNPGLVYTNETAYVFGGSVSRTRRGLNCGERFCFRQKTWTMLPTTMENSRFQFTPFCHMHTIYLAGGLDTTSVEAFDIPSERFSQLPLTLPKNFCTTCFVYNDELVVVQGGRLIRWALNSHTGEAVKKGIEVNARDSNVGVQIVGRKAYFAHETSENACEIYEVDLQIWDVVQVTNLANAPDNPPCRVA